MQISRNDELNANALSPIRRSREFDSNETISQFCVSIQPREIFAEEKHALQRTSTELGTEIDFSNVQPENAHASIRRTWQFRSNVKLARDRHLTKHRVARISTVQGIQTDRNFVQDAKQVGSMVFSVDFASKTKVLISRWENPCSGSFVTEFGTKTEWIQDSVLEKHSERITEMQNFRPLAQIKFRGKNNAIDAERPQQSAQ
jgi:hypothetical protein